MSGGLSKDEELVLFAQLANNPRFKVWLEQERADAVKFLALGQDNTALRRAQGKYSFIEKMSELLAHANKGLR